MSHLFHERKNRQVCSALWHLRRLLWQCIIIRLWKSHWHNSLYLSALRLWKFVAKNLKFGVCHCYESQFWGFWSRRKNKCVRVSLCLSSISNLFFRFLLRCLPHPPLPQHTHPSQLQTDLTSLKLRGDETVSQSSHFNSALLGGKYCFFIRGHCSSSPGRQSRSEELPSNHQPLLRPQAENEYIKKANHKELHHKA